jgi:hypothetical protein
MNCYRHPEAEAEATCVACGKPICEECREEVAGHPMCHACVAAAQARLSQPEAPRATADPPQVALPAYAPAGATAYAYAPSIGRRILRGMLWGVWYGQWWTLWSVLSLFLWGQGSFGAGLVLYVLLKAIVNGFFGSLAGLIIGAVDASPSIGAAIGIGTGLVLCGAWALLFQNAMQLINFFFYFITGRFVGFGITGRVQKPVLAKAPTFGAPAQ